MEALVVWWRPTVGIGFQPVFFRTNQAAFSKFPPFFRDVCKDQR
jgi:hypothetical protein